MIDVFLPLAVAVIVGLALGLEREMSHRPAGLRTQLLVTVGTTIFVLAGRSYAPEEVSRISANVMTGIGFLGAGVILQHQGAVRGMTTASLIWVNGALGLAIALEKYFLVAIGALIALAALKFLGVVEKRIGLKCRTLKYQLITTESEKVIQFVQDALAECHYQEGPLSFDRKNGQLTLKFTFCSSPDKHNKFVEKLRKLPEVTEIQVV